MIYSTYETVSKLTSEQLRLLLLNGDAPERVWATWALGLKNTQIEFEPSEAINEPSPGVRLNLVVLIASNGDRNILEALALNDPDVNVRASACQYINRISKQKNELDHFLSLVLTSSDFDVVKQRILIEFLENSVVLTTDLVCILLKSESEEVRMLLLKSLQKMPQRYDLTGMKSEALVPALLAEKVVAVRDRLYSVCRSVACNRELLELNPKNEEIMIYFLEKIEKSDAPLLWSDIDTVISNTSSTVKEYCLSLFDSQNNPECIVWALSYTNNLRIADEYEYYTVRNHLLILLQSFEGVQHSNQDAESLLVSVINEKESIMDSDTQDWDPEQEYRYLSQFATELEKWR